MKKVFVSFFCALLLVGAAILVIATKPVDSVLKENLEALTDTETSIPTIPCIQAVSVCSYLVKDTEGNTYMASTTGMRNAY